MSFWPETYKQPTVYVKTLKLQEIYTSFSLDSNKEYYIHTLTSVSDVLYVFKIIDFDFDFLCWIINFLSQYELFSFIPVSFHLLFPVNSLCSLFSCSYWYCCVDVSVSRQMLVTGDNVGQLLLLGLDGQKVCVRYPIK